MRARAATVADYLEEVGGKWMRQTGAVGKLGSAHGRLTTRNGPVSTFVVLSVGKAKLAHGTRRRSG